jgi:TonB family protein
MRTFTRLIAALSLILMTTIGATQSRTNTLEQEAKRQVGHVATLCGVIVAYQCRRPERTSLLALDKSFSDGGVSVAIAQEDRGKFGMLFEPRNVFRNVCATGPVERRKNRYLIHVEEPGQLSFRGDSAPLMRFGAESVSACDVGVTLPKLVTEVKPVYTRAALDLRIQGAVLLEALVLTNGQVADTRVLRSLDSRLGLDTEAIKALKAWRFEAGTRDGKAVPVVVTVEVSFRLK